MPDPLDDRFTIVARAKHDALVEIYDALTAAAPDPGDKALYQRQSAAKAVLTHLVLLRKLLHLDVPAKVSVIGSDALDISGYRAMVAALDEENEDG